MLAMSLSLLHFIGLFLLGLISVPACHAFEFDLPSRIPTNQPIIVGYRMKFDGSDELRWLVNITDVDGSHPEILNDGEIFETQGFRGFIQVVIPRDGPFLLRAVNPDFPSQRYATSSPGFAINFDSNDPNEGSGTGDDGDTDGDGTDDGTGDGAESGEGDSDGSGNGSGSGSETDPDEDPDDDDSTSASPSTASSRPSRSPNAPVGANKKATNYGLIAGCIAAGVAVLIIILVVLFWFRRAKNSSKPGRPLTFYRDRMIRAPTPPPNDPPPMPVRISEPMSVVRNPQDPYVGHAGMAYIPPGYGNYPYGTPHSASTAVGPPVMREFILSPRALPQSPGKGPPLKEFILRSPRPRESLAYSKP